jgi:hypothetical protein
VAAASTFAACTDRAAPEDDVVAVATRPEASLRIEPPRLRAGDAVTVEISLRTPPDQHPAPWTPPELDDVWILDVGSPEVRREPGQWLHVWSVRLRPRTLGVLRWPDTTLAVVDAADRTIEVPLAGRTFEVVAPPPVFAERDGPYGMLRPEPETRGPGWPAVAFGFALGAVFAGAAAWLWRQRRPAERGTTDSEDLPAAPAHRDLFEWAERELAAADRALADAPREGARRAALTLRAFVARRFDLGVRTRTTPELAAGEPPFAARSRWPWFLRLLRDLDDLRFRRGTAGSSRKETTRRAAAAIEETRRFVEESRPVRRAS